MYIALYFILKVPQPELHSSAHFNIRNEWAKKLWISLRAYGLATPLLKSKAGQSVIFFSVAITPSVCPFKQTPYCSIYLLCFKLSVVSNGY